MRDHEKRDVYVKWIVGVVLFLFVFGLCLHGIVAGFLALLKRVPPSTDFWNPVAHVAQAGPGQPPFPVLQVSAPLDLQDFLKRENAELDSYGWIDRHAGIVRMPIDEAMNLVLQEGLPVRSSANKNRIGPSPYQLIKQRSEHREPETQEGK